jgi:hypothetical protein
MWVQTLINRAEAVLGAVHETYAARRKSAEQFIRQMVLISLQKGTFYPIWTSSLSNPDKLVSIWQSCVADSDLVQGTRQVLLAVHYVDALRILSETIERLRL